MFVARGGGGWFQVMLKIYLPEEVLFFSNCNVLCESKKFEFCRAEECPGSQYVFLQVYFGEIVF